MSHQSQSSRLKVLSEAALQDYGKQTGITLAKYPLVEQFHNCDTFDSVTAVLDEQLRTFTGSEIRSHKIMKPAKNIVSILYKLSATAQLEAVSLVRRKAPMAFPMSDLIL
jgi:hypothetical protein